MNTETETKNKEIEENQVEEEEEEENEENSESFANMAEEEEEEDDEDDEIVDLGLEDDDVPLEPIVSSSPNRNSIQPGTNLNRLSSGNIHSQANGTQANNSEINDPNVKRLMTDSSEKSNADVINMLLNSDILQTKSKTENKQKGKKQFNVQSRYRPEELQNDPLYKSNFFHVYSVKETPEATSDFSTAVKKVLSKINKEGDKDEILKILISDKERLHAEIEKLDNVKRDYIEQKVKTYLSNRQKKKEKIEEKLNEQFMQDYTFSPNLINKTGDQRNLEQFLNDQNNHNKKVQEKIKMAQEENKRREEDLVSAPLIDSLSEKIFNEKIKTEEPTHLRLYNKRFNTTKKGILEEKSKMNDNGMDEEKKIKPSNSASKLNTQQHVINLYKSGLEKTQRIDALKKKIEKDEKNITNEQVFKKSNKVLMEIFMKEFKKKVDSLFSAEDNHTNHLTCQQVNEVLFSLGFCDFKINSQSEKPNQEEEGKSIIENLDEEKPKSNEDNAEVIEEDKPSLNVDRNENSSSPLSIHQTKEKKLLNDLFAALKNSDDLISVDQLFIFILAIVNLYDYFLYSSYKRSDSDNPRKDSKIEKLDKKEVLSRISADIETKISSLTSSSRYGAFDESGAFLISIEKAKMINKDFNIFYINFMNKGLHRKKTNQVTETHTYRPTINENSNRLYSEYRKKILDLNNSSDTGTLKKEKEKGILSYIDKLIVKKRKNAGYYAKLKEEIKDSEMNCCTFKPEINKDGKWGRKTSEVDKRTDRWTKLSKLGKILLSTRKDRTKEEIETEKNALECTFKPELKNEIISEDTKIQNDIYHEKSYELLYNRLKQGRLERIIKDSIHERGDFPAELEEYLLKCKDLTTFEFKRTNAKPKVKSEEEKISNATKSEKAESSLENEGEKKDAIPLLIIDVNIRPGVKKKIYVFDGDSADSLAEKFSKEHNLDNDTKAKLQVLIGSHMSRLLMRIDEENQSVSEKSSTYNLA